jgi:hypothetical protein
MANTAAFGLAAIDQHQAREQEPWQHLQQVLEHDGHPTVLLVLLLGPVEGAFGESRE